MVSGASWRGVGVGDLIYGKSRGWSQGGIGCQGEGLAVEPATLQAIGYGSDLASALRRPHR